MSGRGEMVRRCVSRLLAAAVAATSVVIVVGAAPASACSCVDFTDADAVEGADAVFTGSLVDTIEPPRWLAGISGDSTRLILEVDRVFKGEVFERQSVVTPRDDAGCGRAPRGAGPYLVVALEESGLVGDAVDGELHTGLCSGARPVADGALPGVLGEGSNPLPGSSPIGGGLVPAPVKAGAAVAAALGLAIVAALGVRRRRRRRRA